jgi:hypothetical protein
MVREKPVVQQNPRRAGDALVAAFAPVLHLVADARHARRGGNFGFQQAELAGVFCLFAWHNRETIKDKNQHPTGVAAFGRKPHFEKPRDWRRSAETPLR